MPLIYLDLEGVDELDTAFSIAVDTFGPDLRNCVLQAADAAIAEMQNNHPYTDRTNLLSRGMEAKIFGRVSRDQATALVTFKAKYAKFVNDGTVKTKPYPFVPQGLEAAGNELERCVGLALDAFCERATR